MPLVITSNRSLNPLVEGANPSKRRRPTAKKPDIESCAPVRGNARSDPVRDSTRRQKGHPGVEPPRIYRLPITRSAVPSIKGASKRLISPGGWLRSASITSNHSPVATRAPDMIEAAKPGTALACVSSRMGTVVASERMISQVPSLDSPSTKTISAIGAPLAIICEKSGLTFVASFRVGTIIETSAAVALRSARLDVADWFRSCSGFVEGLEFSAVGSFNPSTVSYFGVKPITYALIAPEMGGVLQLRWIALRGVPIF